MSRIWPSWKNTSTLGGYFQGRMWTEGATGHQRKLINPRTGQKLSVTIQDTTVNQVYSMVSFSRQAQQTWASFSSSVRRDMMLALAQATEDHKQELTHLEILQTGKPFSDAFGEVQETINCLRYFAGYADKPRGISLTDYDGMEGLHMTTQLEPIGVCGLITSFNYPLMLTGWKLAPALAAGNSVIIKPAPQTPLTTLALADLAKNILPMDLVQVVTGGLEVGQAIVDVAEKTSFTGSTPAGQAIMRQAADRLQPLTLECGGKNTVIVDQDADLSKAAYHIAQGAFSNAGQNCCAVSRVLVHSSIHAAFLEHLKVETKRWRPVINDEEHQTTEIDSSSSYYYYGPLIDQQQFDRVRHYLDHSTYTPLFRDQQSTLSSTTAGTTKGYYVSPTVYDGVDDMDSLAQEEIFGPVLSVLRPFDTIQEAIERTNGTTPFGLAAGVFSNRYSTAHSIASKLQAGIVWVNTYNMIPPMVPFGGRKLSGFGKDLGQNALYEFSFTKSILHSI
ncbi:retinal dehydrogenase [Halteromyces radiatus]|uniref:retinal dehydrogenase n=1 Tax=Halteromyces radiatus TaxID=101107 RepID=UPI00221F1170|nr:retinal dehydrogenase [Halteromyces radiatus]KAI8099757.1 retinal dehydrogenase [Halteromyces radiatus]